MSPWIYYTLVFLLFTSNVLGFLFNFAALPGNWQIVLGCGLFWAFVRSSSGVGISGAVLVILIGLALVGEAVEFLAGTAGAAKQGASRRAMVLSVVGSLVGGLGGALAGTLIPLPVVGQAIGAVLGGSLGAGLGALVGEDWKGRKIEESLHVGVGAFVGRLLGTVGKIATGGVMVGIATVDSIW